MSLSAKTIQIVKTTAPVVGANAVKIVEDFYPRMFRNNPETLNFFNKANQGGMQQNALAAAVVAYATNIEDLSPVVPALPRIIHKHVALDVHAEHYAIVAKNLIASIGHILGDAVTADVAGAWQEAVMFLAKMLMEKENALREEVSQRSNGWNGYRPFRIASKVMMSDDCCKFRFEPVEGDAPFDFLPGQYLSIKVPVGKDEVIAPRHYTVVSSPGEPFLECCTKRLEGGDVSNRLHRLPEGTVVHLAPPVGVDLVPRPGPAVVIGGGIGITPIVCLAKNLPTESVKAVIQVDRSPENAPFREYFMNSPIKDAYHFVTAAGDDHAATLASVLKHAGVIDTATKYYICGPNAFMNNVELALLTNGATNVFTERFGPHSPGLKSEQPQKPSCPFK